MLIRKTFFQEKGSPFSLFPGPLTSRGDQQENEKKIEVICASLFPRATLSKRALKNVRHLPQDGRRKERKCELLSATVSL